MTDAIIPAAAASAVAFLVVLVMTPPLIRALERRNFVVRDICKKDVMVARPGGISLVAGIVAAETVLYAFWQSDAVLAVMATTAGAFVVGYVDDRRRMGGWYKPIALAFAALPIIALGAYDHSLAFPLFGEVYIPILYLGLIVIMVSVTGNTINSIDVLNGVASGFVMIASFSLALCLVIMGNGEAAAMAAVLGFASLAFYRYHRLPSRIFPGDSGALLFGSTYGAIAIIGEAEVVAAVALLPAIINSFLFLASVKRIVEHTQLKSRPVRHDEEFRLHATDAKDAPVTLVRLIIAGGPMTEAQVASVILKLAVFSGGLAVITALMMGVRL